MVSEPPEGSRIKVEREIDSTRYIWREPKKTIGHYLTLAFLFFFFCAWTGGCFVAIFMLFIFTIGCITGKIPVFAPLFILCWLGAWTVGGIAVLRPLYAALRRQKPSVVTIAARGVTFETGTHSPDLGLSRSRSCPSTLAKCKNRLFDLTELGIKTVQLDRPDEKQRLYFDCGAERIEIGQTLTEPEREWLHNVLTAHLAQIG